MPGPGKICLGPGKILVLSLVPSPPKEDTTSHVQSIVRSQVSCGHETCMYLGGSEGRYLWPETALEAISKCIF